MSYLLPTGYAGVRGISYGFINKVSALFVRIWMTISKKYEKSIDFISILSYNVSNSVEKQFRYEIKERFRYDL